MTAVVQRTSSREHDRIKPFFKLSMRYNQGKLWNVMCRFLQYKFEGEGLIVSNAQVTSSYLQIILQNKKYFQLFLIPSSLTKGDNFVLIT